MPRTSFPGHNCANGLFGSSQTLTQSEFHTGGALPPRFHVTASVFWILAIRTLLFAKSHFEANRWKPSSWPVTQHDDLLILKTIGNRKGDCAWSCSRWQTPPEKICKLQSTNQYNVLPLYLYQTAPTGFADTQRVYYPPSNKSHTWIEAQSWQKNLIFCWIRQVSYVHKKKGKMIFLDIQWSKLGTENRIKRLQCGF